MAIQIIPFTGEDAQLQKACEQACYKANQFIKEESIPNIDTEDISLQVSHSVVDGITWHYAIATISIDCQEALEDVIEQILGNSMDEPKE